MKLKEPSKVAVIFDSSILIGIFFEREGRETGKAEEAFELFKRQGNHILYLSEFIFSEVMGRLWREGQRGVGFIRELMDLIDPLLGKKKIKKPLGTKLKNIQITFSLPNRVRHDEEIIKAAIVGEEECKLAYLVHKNPRHFNLIKQQMQAQYNILVLEAPDYIDP